MPGMNEEVRSAVKRAMKREKITQEEMAERIGIHRVHVNRMLTGAASQTPEAWEKMLGELGLELTVKEKGNATE